MLKFILLFIKNKQENFLLFIITLTAILDFGIISPLWLSFHYRFPLFIKTIFLLVIFFTMYILGQVLLFNKPVSKYVDLYIVLYSIYLFSITYLKANFTHMQFILNPLTSFLSDFTLSPIALLNTIGNFFMYFPIGVYFKCKSYLENYLLVLFFIVFIVLVELLQGISKTGVCDTNDMLTNTISFYLGLKFVQARFFSTDLKKLINNLSRPIINLYMKTKFHGKH
ncbi:MAG: VanZ family protein [Clostridium sp.]|uniref:VanZ family protein n=1 Tax=Clostridium sp. TaxID=1506 RepID=UPI003F3910F1